MANGNNITVVGNCTRDPELRYMPSGQAQTGFGIAVSRRWQNKQTNEWEEQTSFMNVVVWGPMAENVAESVTKGSRILVSGRLDVRSYEKKDGGGTGTSVDIVADEIGPSLRWATAQVTRNERSESPNGGGRTSPKAAAPAAPAYDYGEEPFG